MLGREKQGLIPYWIALRQLREHLLSSKLCWLLLPGQGLPATSQGAWLDVSCRMCYQHSSSASTAGRAQRARGWVNARVCARCSADPLGSPTKYFIWTKLRAQPHWLQSPEHSLHEWDDKLSSAWTGSAHAFQISSAHASKRALATPAQWEWGICKGQLASFSSVPNKEFPSFVSAVSSPSRSFSPPPTAFLVCFLLRLYQERSWERQK